MCLKTMSYDSAGKFGSLPDKPCLECDWRGDIFAVLVLRFRYAHRRDDIGDYKVYSGISKLKTRTLSA